MKTRVITSVVGIALLALVLLFYNTIFFNVVMSVVTLIAIHEVYNAFKFGKNSLFLFIGFIPFTLCIMFSDYGFIQRILMPVCYIFIVYLALCVIINFDTINFAKLAGMSLFSLIIILCFYSLISLKSKLPSDTNGSDAVYFIVLILGLAWGGDTCAYFTGNAFGKHKLAPKVSPNKTIEGAMGGVLGSMLTGLLITLIYYVLFQSVHIRGVYYLAIAALGLLGGVLGIIGDLFASAVKRQNGIKDYGTIFPGHGGILDRFDSVLFIAPLVSMAVRVVYYKLNLL